MLNVHTCCSIRAMNAQVAEAQEHKLNTLRNNSSSNAHFDEKRYRQLQVCLCRNARCSLHVCLYVGAISFRRVTSEYLYLLCSPKCCLCAVCLPLLLFQFCLVAQTHVCQIFVVAVPAEQRAQVVHGDSSVLAGHVLGHFS